MTGAWYETMSQLNGGGAKAQQATAGSAAASGDSVASFKEQLSTTHLFYTPASALAFVTAPQLKEKMELVRQICFRHGLLGERTASADDVTVMYPDKAIQGKKDRVRLRFDDGYMKQASEGQAVTPGSPVFEIQAKPRRMSWLALSWMLFAVGIGLYWKESAVRHRENADDRVVPGLDQMAHGLRDAAMNPPEEDDDGQAAGRAWWTRLSHSMLWKDTAASARRLTIGVALLVPAVLLGLHIGMFPWFGALFLRFVLFFDKIVALSLLPILFIAFGIGELSKIMLIVIGVAPTIILDTINLTKSVPREQVVKGFTLGASDSGVAYRIVLKQILPRVINGIRLNLKPLMLFLFAGETIASTDGLAYRIALMRGHMGMDIIIPYVLWVALLLFLVDAGLRLANRKLHPWFQEA